MTEKHYKLREDLTIEVYGRKLFRIEATKDLEKYNVKKGDLGGYVEREDNLSGNAWVFGDAKVYGNARVYGNAWVYGNAKVCGNAWVFGDAKVFGNAWVFGDAKVCGNAWVFGNARVYGNAWVYGDAEVFGDKLEKAEDIYNITSNSQYNITILPNTIKIGCQFHKKEDWWNFTDREIIEMDGKSALEWWRVWKPILQAICGVKV